MKEENNKTTDPNKLNIRESLKLSRPVKESELEEFESSDKITVMQALLKAKRRATIWWMAH